MKIDPVYLLAPEPKPPVVPTRRAFLLAGVAFAGGASLGAACGYSAASKANAGSTEEPDATLDWLLHLAAPQTPIEELLASGDSFLMQVDTNYPQDDRLWVGVHRLADRIANDSDLKDRRILAKVIVQMAQKHTRTDFDSAVLGELRRVR